MSDERCVFCQQPATLLCDFILGFKFGGYSGCDGAVAYKVGRLSEYVPGKGLPCVDSDDPEMFTCDAPMCESCSKCSGHVFFDGDATHTFIESIDHCPMHHSVRLNPRPITAEAAERMREMAWKRKPLQLFGATP